MLVLPICLCVALMANAIKLEPPMTTMTVTVLNELGQPIQGAIVYPNVWSTPRFKNGQRYVTNIDGVAVFDRPKTLRILRVWISTTNMGHVALSRGWETGTHHDGKDIPASITFRMEQATSIGGRVVDENGNGVPNVIVKGSCEIKPENLKLKNGIGYSAPLNSVTDERGFWFCDNVPNVPADYSLRVQHPDYVTDKQNENLHLTQGITSEQLRAGTAVLTLKRGNRLHGQVTDADGKPIEGAYVIFSDFPYGPPNEYLARTDAQGNYELPALAPGEQAITVVAKEKMPIREVVDLKVGKQRKNFQLGSGHRLRLRFVNEAGLPVPATAYFDRWQRVSSLSSFRFLWIPHQADKDGLYEWNDAPKGELDYRIWVADSNYQQLRMSISVQSGVQTIVLKEIPIVTGTVIDAVTGKPIEKFTALRVSERSASHVQVDRFSSRKGEIINYLGNGKFTVKLDRADEDNSILIEAPGYRGELSMPHLIANKISNVTIAMQAADPITGRILDLNGKPVAGTKIGLGSRIENIQDELSDYGLTVVTDKKGRFEFPAQGEPFVLYTKTAEGFIHRAFEPDAKVGDLRVDPGVRIEGTVYRDGKPVPEATLYAHPISTDPRLMNGPTRQFGYRTETDSQGRYEFHIPWTEITILNWNMPDDKAFLHFLEDDGRLAFSATPGVHNRFDLGKGGTTVEGQLVFPDNWTKGIDLIDAGTVMLTRRTPDVPYPAVFDDEDQTDIAKNPAGLFDYGMKLELHRRYRNDPTPTGAFRIHAVQPGDYWLSVRMENLDKEHGIGDSARVVIPITIPKDKKSITLPKLSVPMIQPLPLGEPLPAFPVRGYDGKPIDLTKYRGKPLLLHAWGRGVDDNPKLRVLSKANLAIVGLAYIYDADEMTKLAKKHLFTWPQAHASRELIEAWHIRVLPYYLLLDARGKLLYRGNDIDAVQQRLAK